MDRIHLGYSTKNIPTQTRYEYLKDLTKNIESFSRRIRWKALVCLGEITPSDKVTYGFKSPMTPPLPNHPEAKYLQAFERDLFDLPSTILL